MVVYFILLLEIFRLEDEDEYEIWLKFFFAYSQNIDFPESLILPFFTWKVNTVVFSEEGYNYDPTNTLSS